MDIFSLVWQQVKETGYLQWAAVGLGVAEVLLARANKILLYPTGIAASAISMYLLWTAGLFGEAALNLYYVIMSIYGWWYWHKKRNLPPVKITRTTKREWMVVTAMLLAGYLIIFFVLEHHTTSTVPQLDAFVSITAWAGMWLLARRKLENWIMLNVSNAVAIPLLYNKGLILFSALTLFLFIVAVQGYFSWKKKMKHDNGHDPIHS